MIQNKQIKKYCILPVITYSSVSHKQKDLRNISITYLPFWYTARRQLWMQTSISDYINSIRRYYLLISNGSVNILSYYSNWHFAKWLKHNLCSQKLIRIYQDLIKTRIWYTILFDTISCCIDKIFVTIPHWHY